MLVSLNELKKYVDYGSLTAEELAELITKSGIEVDGIHYIAPALSEHIVVGYVKACEQHPNADKLSLCQVDVGEADPLQIICGAANIAKGQKVVVAKPGAVLPGDFEIKLVKLRGIESNGMICSMSELGVAEQHIPEAFSEGIIELPEGAVVGESVVELLNLDDAILEFDLTPNRADALSLIGVAYEVAAILDKEVTLPDPTVETTEEDVADYVKVTVEDADLCPYYGAFIVKDVEVGPAPLWMQNFLIASGIRPINNVVDITNYVLLEYGQPLHAFDYDLLDSKEVLVRRATDGEKIVTLDDQERQLNEANLLITNGKEGIALAGVMGGANTEVSDETTTILLEAAYFDVATVRKAVAQTGLRSEASNRFEKGVDPSRVQEAGLRACELLVTYANGKLVANVAAFNELDVTEKKVAMNANEVNKRLGTEIAIEEMEDVLRKLRFNYERNEADFTVSIPTRRGDITIFEDMVEEVARIYGYDNVPYTLPANASKPGGLNAEQQLQRNVNAYMQSVGLAETITYSLTKKENVTKLVTPELNLDGLHPVKLAMPLSEDHEYLRLSIVPELLKVLAHNVARKQNDLAFYEIGSVFLSEEENITKQPKEHTRLVGALTGLWVDHKWQEAKVPVDFYIVKGIVEGLFEYLNIDVTFAQATMEHMHPGRCATIEREGEVIGFLGQVHPTVAKEYDLKETYVFDINMEYIVQFAREERLYDPIPQHPANMRDVAFVVDQSVAAGAIQAEIEKVGAPLVKKVEAFDVYVGENVAETEKSIAYSLQFQDPERTLTDKEVDSQFEKIMETIQEKFAAVVRRS